MFFPTKMTNLSFSQFFSFFIEKDQSVRTVLVNEDKCRLWLLNLLSVAMEPEDKVEKVDHFKEHSTQPQGGSLVYQKNTP